MHQIAVLVQTYATTPPDASTASHLRDGISSVTIQEIPDLQVPEYTRWSRNLLPEKHDARPYAGGTKKQLTFFPHRQG